MLLIIRLCDSKKPLILLCVHKCKYLFVNIRPHSVALYLIFVLIYMIQMYIIDYISQNNGILTMLIKGGRNIARSCVVISSYSSQELPPLHVLVLFNLIGRFLWLMIPT